MQVEQCGCHWHEIQNKIKHGLRQQPIGAWLRRKICWHRTSTQVECDSSQHNINILFDPPTPKQWSHNTLRTQARSKTPSSPIVDHFSQEGTSGQRSRDEVNITVTGSQRERGKRRERKMKNKSEAFYSCSITLWIPGFVNCTEAAVHLLLTALPIVLSLKPLSLIHYFWFSSSEMKLCLLSNWGPAPSGPNQSNLPAFLEGGRSQERNYYTSRPFALCNFTLL